MVASLRLVRRLFVLVAALPLATVPWAASAAAQDAASDRAQSPTAIDYYYPGPSGEWEHRAPEDVGIDPALLAEAIEFAKANETDAPRDLALAHALAWHREPYDGPVGPFKQRGDQTGLVIRNGYIVAEWGEPWRVDMTFSVTKSFLSSVVGVAYDRGLIPALDEPVGRRVPYYIPAEPLVRDPVRGPAGAPIPLFESEHNRRITWNHLLRQTSDWEGTLFGKPDWADRPRGESSTWLTRERNAPGTAWKYNDVRVNLLALAALYVLRDPLPRVLREHVMDPIGASRTWQWHGYANSWVVVNDLRVQSVSGGGHWGGGMWISARDQARFGLLTLRRGRWKNRQILSGEWIQKALTPTKANPGYGFMNYFLNTDRERFPSAPESAFAHLGAGTNMVYVDPVHGLVVVARWIDGGALAGFIERVLAAVEAEPRT